MPLPWKRTTHLKARRAAASIFGNGSQTSGPRNDASANPTTSVLVTIEPGSGPSASDPFEDYFYKESEGESSDSNEFSSAVPATHKRKATDPWLKTVNVDPMYDLTLIVGTPEYGSGQRAFQINKGSFRNASRIWSKMLSGDWKESDMYEIEFPDDDCNAFQIILRIAHLQLPELPDKFSLQELVDLTMLTDKYELQKTVKIGLEMKKCMEQYPTTPVSLSPGINFQ